ncbi:MAG: hypothetical protein PGMFKBFP_03240 [Anaerolineales bacterium]|nr:hypothetical protein [Anaerolineales bacterium]
MRLLDLHHRQRGEGRRQERDFAVIDARYDEVQKEDAEQIGEGRELAAEKFQRSRRRAKGLIRHADNGHRQVAVDEKARAAVARIKRGSRGVEVFPNRHPALAFGRTGVNRNARVHAGVGAQVFGHSRQEQLVGMLVLSLAPGRAAETQIRRHSEDGDEEQVV